MTYQEIQTPCGILYIGEHDGALCLCDWHCPEGATSGRTDLIDEAARQIEDYFAGTLKIFTLPLRPDGTDFQKKVWAAIASVPYGATFSYSQLAAAIGSPNAVRAVARACGANKLSVIIPCHRIVASDGKLTGYAGGLPAKEYLLTLEKGNTDI